MAAWGVGCTDKDMLDGGERKTEGGKECQKAENQKTLQLEFQGCI
jgi:hypothetical protein